MKYPRSIAHELFEVFRAHPIFWAGQIWTRESHAGCSDNELVVIGGTDDGRVLTTKLDGRQMFKPNELVNLLFEYNYVPVNESLHCYVRKLIDVHQFDAANQIMDVMKK